MFKDELIKVLEELEYPSDEVEVIKSNRPDLCDYQFDGAFKLAKVLHKSPFEIGNNIVNKYKEMCDMSIIANIECVNGFVNFKLSSLYINKMLNKMINSESFNIHLPPKEKIVIDYGGANVAKPLHVGHLRPAIVGESVKRILKFMNQEVISDVHLGDYGLQIGEVIYGLKKENIECKDININLLDRIYPQMSALCKEDESVKNECASITKELQDGNVEYQEYFKKILEISKKDIKKNYDYLDVSFDLWYGESDAYKYIPELTNILNKQNLLTLSEGALVVDVSKEDDKNPIPPFIYQKSNKAYLYGTTDLATILERQQDFAPDKIIYLTDARQSLHFTQVFRVSKMLNATKNIDLEFLGLGTINGSDGKPYKTRSGNTPKLRDLFTETKEIFKNKREENENISESDLDIIANSIIKFADLQNNPHKEYIFDIQKFSDVVGKTGPYILYTYLRTNKIVINNPISIDKLNETIYNNQDRELRTKLLELDSIMNYAFENRLPSIIANYLYELCVLLNTFYEKNHINNLEDIENKENWILLLNLTTKIIKTLLDLLVIKIPSKM